MKRTPLKRKTTLKAKTPLNRAKRPQGEVKVPKSRKVTKTIQKGYQVPNWFKSIPLGSHGNSPTQKRYWKVVSDLVRQRDFKKYGRCVSCGVKVADWKDCDAAHFKRYSVCNSYMKFNVLNIALSCKGCNRNDDGVVGYAFGMELQRRYGKDHVKWIEKENLKWRGAKLENQQIVENVEKLLEENPWFILP